MKKWFFFVVLFFNITGIMSQETVKVLETAFKKGEARSISKYFNENIDLEINELSDIYKKNEAEIILIKFFSSENVINFDILHKGQKENSEYLIGTLKTSKKNYRVTILLKDNLIIQLRIQLYEFQW